MEKRMGFIFIVLMTFSQVLVSCQEALCRDRYGLLPPRRFNHRACTMCYVHLFSKSKELTMGPTLETLVPRNMTHLIVSDPISPDITNETTSSAICSTLDDVDCDRWRACCVSASTCCARMQEMPWGMGGNESKICPKTWDGFGCWDDTSSGITAYKTCPSFIGYSITNRRSIKACMDNGTWFKKNGMQEWTDYRPCIDKEGYIIGVYISIGCTSTSLILLLPAITIFLVFRDLRNQHRVRLHVQFFLSLVLAGVANILWFVFVDYDLLVSGSNTDTAIFLNPVWCRLLSFAKIYLTATNYFWMFGEGYFLHRLISNAFEPPKSLAPVYFLGWAAPCAPALSYALARAFINNESCWAISLEGFQWFIYAPNFICLVANLLFLCNILRILLFQLHAHPHEPSNFRRGLKAAFMLIPLFGLHTFVTIYRPPPGNKGEKEWEYVTFFITYLQGAFVALIYCFFNGEVLSHFKKLCTCLLGERRLPTGTFTQVTLCDGRSPTNSVRGSNSRLSVQPQNGKLLTNGQETKYELKDIESADPKPEKGEGSKKQNQRNGTSPNHKGYSPIPTIVTTNA